MRDEHEPRVSQKFRDASLEEKRLAILTLAANRSLSMLDELSEGSSDG